MPKRPSFQMYPGDWRRDTGLMSCSLTARGLWHEMMMLMHDGEPYGHLKVGSKVILPPNLARMVGATLEEVESCLAELEEADVFSRLGDGTIYCRRMVRDEKVRQARAAGGKLGGNPALMKDSKDNQKGNQKDNLRPNLPPTPASASASASSKDPPSPPKGGKRRGRKIPAVRIPEALQAIGIDRSAFEQRVKTCKVAKRPETWQSELDLLAPMVDEVGGALVFSLWQESYGTGWQGVTPTICRERAARAKPGRQNTKRLDTSGMPKEYRSK